MLPNRRSDDLLEDGVDPQTIASGSFLNVNATEFVPSNAAPRQEFTNSAPFTPEPVVRSSATSNNFSSVQRQEYSDYLLMDQMKNLMGCATNNGGIGREQRQEYTYTNTPIPYTSWGYRQNLSIGGRETHGGAVTSSQRQEYRHSLSSSIDQQNFAAARAYETNFAEPVRHSSMHEYRYNVPFSAVDQTQVFNSGYESNNNRVAKFQFQEVVPIPSSEENRFINQNLMHCYKDACDTALLPGDNWDKQLALKNLRTSATSCDAAWSHLGGSIWGNQPQQPELNYKGPNATACVTALSPPRDDWGKQNEFKYKGTSTTAPCLPDANSLIVSSNLSSENLMEVAGAAPLQPVNINEGTIDSILITDDGLRNKKNGSMSVEPAATHEDNNRVEEDQPLKNIKQSKKKNRPRANKEVFSKKEHVNIVFIGHVDAGKSTLGGQLMYLTGIVDERTMKKYEKEAKEKSRDSWYLSWALDTNQEERDRGKTVETGRGHFETASKHFTILDAPGHKSFVPNMICGAAQADVAVLVLSARQNEFESGFDKGGQTRDHAMLARSAGLNVLIALVNKMDDSTVQWNEERFNYCRDQTLPFLKKLGYAPIDIHFLPVSAQTGDGIMTAVPKSKCPWFEGPSFIECLDKLSPISRRIDSPFVMPIAEKFKDMGTVIMGKVEAGTTHISDSLLVMPNKVAVTVEQIWSDDKPVTTVKAGENVKIRVKGIEEEDISPGFVLCDSKKPVTTATLFDAQLHILECKSIITPGFSAVMHFQSVAETITVTHLICLIDAKTNEKTHKLKLHFVKKNDNAIIRMKCSGVICLTVFKHFDQLGRFTLRDDNKVIAIGKVLHIIK